LRPNFAGGQRHGNLRDKWDRQSLHITKSMPPPNAYIDASFRFIELVELDTDTPRFLAGAAPDS
ncbi:hypothetical protein, partial [Roseiconus lacunae]|uniref:hypothetical protein n=1 Tax=Roseiconus lacunae TaxID=2605694 RepID=UPI001E4FA962